MSYEVTDSSLESSVTDGNAERYSHGPGGNSVRAFAGGRSSTASSGQSIFYSEPLLRYNGWKHLSTWSLSGFKRAFDCACVVWTFPLWLPILILVGIAVRLTSRGPVLFMQTRSGRHGKAFTILKFRTMAHIEHVIHCPVTTASNQRFTSIGPFLRRWKLDELPQVFNVLAGDMSLVGPRPKLPEHTVVDLPCRPGITGAATFAFAREESELAHLPQSQLETAYHALVLPAKHNLDVEYMSKATLSSDLNLVIGSIARRWDDSFLRTLIGSEGGQPQATPESVREPEGKSQKHRGQGASRGLNSQASVEETASV